MKVLKFYLPLLLISLFSFSGFAQKDLKVNEIFETIGKQKGTLIKLGSDVLKPNTNIDQYVSLRIKADKNVSAIVDNALAEDTKWAEGLLNSSDKLNKSETRHYKLAPLNDNSLPNEYILFQQSKGYISLVYLKGNFPSKDLRKELDKLKDLFLKMK